MKGKLVVVLDADRSWADMAAQFLAEAGFEVATAQDAEGALELIAQRLPAAMVLDAQFAGLSGLELLRLLRREGLAIPTLVVSAACVPSLWADALLEGARLVLSKPVSPRFLLRAMEILTADAN
jgi:DNA-binding response OmpR family regulator